MRVRGEYERKGELRVRGREEGQSGSSGRLPLLMQWEGEFIKLNGGCT